MIKEYLIQASVWERLAVSILFIFLLIKIYDLIIYLEKPRSFKLIWHDIKSKVKE